MDELVVVITNWLREARDTGSVTGETNEAAFVAARVVAWLRERADDGLGDAERFAAKIESELKRLGGWKNKGLVEAMEDATHLREALEDLRTQLGLGDAAAS